MCNLYTYNLTRDEIRGDMTALPQCGLDDAPSSKRTRMRLGLEQEDAEALAAELDDAGLVRVGGGHSVTLGPEGWQLLRGQRR